MQSKTDLRVLKTEKAIREAFLDLRKELPLEKVRVIDICRRAMINPSTFYKHYSDVIELSEHMETDLVKRCLQDHNSIDCLLTDPYRYLTGFQSSLSIHEQEINIVFRGRSGVLLEKTEQIIREYYLLGDVTEEKKTLVLFIMGGILHCSVTLNRHRSYPKDVLSRNLADLIERLIKE